MPQQAKRKPTGVLVREVKYPCIPTPATDLEAAALARHYLSRLVFRLPLHPRLPDLTGVWPFGYARCNVKVMAAFVAKSPNLGQHLSGGR